jgi:hypothetical protein
MEMSDEHTELSDRSAFVILGLVAIALVAALFGVNK